MNNYSEMTVFLYAAEVVKIALGILSLRLFVVNHPVLFIDDIFV